MKTLHGQHIYLRALEPEDLDFVYQLENDATVWEISQTQTPYSRFLIRQYLDNAQQDIYEAKQLRLAICKNETFEAIGLIDLFDFDPKNKRAGIGILIQHPDNRNSGYGKEALELLIAYAKDYLHIHQLFANISVSNLPSINLFTSFGFELIGIKKEWIFNDGNYSDEAFYQLIIKK
ncbi:GNAT family N-acetyltransferase [Flavobacterium lacus]|uniref:Diamine N-acetyltransferase n=1 Tax=Flavobacterium lacus TaxID=1353778 RepID=A0A328X6Z3_9FLAO|nr:GNAT family N-acetyltransferase [Flavobacterium lacus]RAR51108.1 diamine N-acetyltransferase [Flavobacterium lacus]